MGRKKRARRNNQANGGGGIVKIQFKSFLTTAVSTNVLVLALSPANLGSGSITPIYTGFELFRFTRLKVTLLPRANLSTLSSGYNADAVMGSPGTHADVMALLDSAIIAGVSTVNGSTVPVHYRVNPKRLRGQLNWYKCTPDAGDTGLEQQGALVWFCTGASDAINSVVEGVVEFKNPVDPTIALQKLKSVVRSELIEEFRTAAPLGQLVTSVPKQVAPTSKALSALVGM